MLTDGASAIYGTDAIAGVINFIMRKDFTGVEASAYYGDSDQGGGKVQRYNATAGWGDLTKDKVNVFGSVDYNKIDAIAANQRNFSKTAYHPRTPRAAVYDKTSGNSLPGNIFWPNRGHGSPAFPTCLPPYSFATSGNGQCRFDYASVIDIVPPSESWNVYGSGRWQFAPDHQAFVEASWSQTKSTSKVSPNAAASAFTLNGESPFLPPTSPFYPHGLAQQFGVDGQPGELFFRMLELGPRTDNNTIEQTRVVGGLKGLLAGWDYALDVNWSQSKSTDDWSAGWALAVGDLSDRQQRRHQPVRLPDAGGARAAEDGPGDRRCARCHGDDDRRQCQGIEGLIQLARGSCGVCGRPRVAP